MKKKFEIVVIALLYIVGCFSFNITAEASVGFTYKVNRPENQKNMDVGYFDLKMNPGQKQTVTIDLTNETDKEVIAVVSLNGAKTSGNGVVEYGPSVIDNDKSLKYDFKDIVKAPEKLPIPAKSTVSVNLDITMPESSFDGVISGGIQLKAEVDKKKREKEKGVINEYAYVIGMLLSETDTVVAPELDLNKVNAGSNNYRNSVFVNMSNTKPVYLENLTMDVQIMKKGSDAVLYDTKKANMRMAPNSMIDFPISMNGERMVPGEYRAHILASTKDKKWEWDKEFTITDEEADKYNDEDISLVQEQGINWKMIILIVGSAIVIIVFIYVIVRFTLTKKKKSKKKKKKK